MSQSPGAGRAAFGQKSAELVVAALFFLVGAIVIYDAARLGIGWQEVHGPRPGYFPFYVGLIMCVASLVNAARVLIKWSGKDRAFVEVGQLKLVLSVLVPTAVYAFLVTWIGVYASSVVFIGFFMRWLGKYGWATVAAISIGVPLVTFVVFERWFLVPLPKGPLENLLGLG